MNVPSMGSDEISREFLRIAGGYGSAATGNSPAGGLDIDNAGHVATDGDVTVGGEMAVGSDLTVDGQLNAGSGSETLTDTAGKLKFSALEQNGATLSQVPQWDGSTWTPATVSGGGGSGDVSAAANFATDNVLVRSDGTAKGVQHSGVAVNDTDDVTGVNDLTMDGDFSMGSTGCNKTWGTSIIPNRDLFAANIQPATLSRKVYDSNRVELYVLSYAGSGVDQATGICHLPEDYDGSPLNFEIFHTQATAGAGDIRMYVTAGAMATGDDLLTKDGTQINGTFTLSGTASELTSDTMTVTPLDAANAAGQMMNLLVGRDAGHVDDTFTGAIEVLYIKVTY